ncbi:GapA-binding peptide SR1P [Paenibacillus aurantiacus]|uniref:GapA-binding peptide SR1P n=1 Tax=Paenibacillus aurantiacus TaxID=1936118 RepID=A0ABV5KSS4_9BACL
MGAERAEVYGSRENYGLVLCRHCNEIIDTLPTNGVKKLYSLCDSERCRSLQAVPSDIGEEPA